MQTDLIYDRSSRMQRLDRILSEAGVASRKELRAIIRAGRAAVNGAVVTDESRKFDETVVCVTVDGEPVRLTPIEYKILLLLMKSPGRVFSAEEIYERVWNEKAINTDTIMVHIRNIREKIESCPKEPKYLKVVWGVGYKIEKQA